MRRSFGPWHFLAVANVSCRIRLDIETVSRMWGGASKGDRCSCFFFYTSSQVPSKVRDHGGGGKGVSGYGEVQSAAYQECLKPYMWLGIVLVR